MKAGKEPLAWAAHFALDQADSIGSDRPPCGVSTLQAPCGHRGLKPRAAWPGWDEPGSMVVGPVRLEWASRDLMTLRFGRIRRFQFNFPQRIAAGLLALFLLQGLWLTEHQTLTERDYQYARCGRETWERPSPLAGYD